MARKKKPRFKAPEGEFERLGEVNSVSIAVEAQGKLPLDIGVELPDGRMQTLVKRGTTIPFRHSEMYSTALAYQTAVEVHFLLGNRPLAKDNLTLGRVRLRNIRWSKQGLPMIDILVGMDEDGTLRLGSNNLDRTRDKGAAIERRESVSAQDMQALLEDAHANEEPDNAWKGYIKESDDARAFINELADVYEAARKKMTFSQKRAHNKVVNRVCKTLNTPIRKLENGAVSQFRADMETLKQNIFAMRQL